MNGLRLVLAGVAIACGGGTLAAQGAVRLTQKEVGQIIDATLAGALPPSTEFSRVPVTERGVRLDVQRSMESFGVTADVSVVRSLRTRREISVGSRELISDCSQGGGKPCARIGSQAYVTVQAESIKAREVSVTLTFSWAVGGGASNRFLTGGATQVFLERTGSGEWKYVRTGIGIAG